MTSATDRVNVMREDKAIYSKEEQEALFNNAPETDGYIKVPSILTKVRTANNGFLPNKLESI